jgi:beta-glucosidase
MRTTLAAALLATTMILPLTQVTGQPTASTPAAAAAKPPANAAYRNASLPVDARVADLLARMTLEEKVGQIVTLWDSKADVHDPDSRWNPAKASQKFPDGLGQIARPSDRSGPSSPRTNKLRSIM